MLLWNKCTFNDSDGDESMVLDDDPINMTAADFVTDDVALVSEQ